MKPYRLEISHDFCAKKGVLIVLNILLGNIYPESISRVQQLTGKKVVFHEVDICNKHALRTVSFYKVDICRYL